MFPINLFKGKHILIGLTGGIAAYKTTELVRYLRTQGAEVQVIMTSAAEKFITRLTLETLAQRPILHEMFSETNFTGTHHIHSADLADAAIIAPATYNFIGKFHAGIADDLLTTTVAALHCPLVIAPAMNTHMWENPILQRNLVDLKKMGYLICPPEEGFLAEGYSGIGRLASLEHQIQFLYKAIHPAANILNHKKVLITAGRTEESLDPVRILTNISSGKMGYALAWEAFARGADVTLVHGPTQLSDPVGIRSLPVSTAQEMFEMVKKQIVKSDYFFSAAAVADYQSEKINQHKIKKDKSSFSLPLKITPDILKYVSENKQSKQILVGFAVETKSPEKNALKKLKEKQLDLIVLNNPLEKGAGFLKDTNQVKLFYRNGDQEKISIQPKIDVARAIFTFLEKKLKSA
jgi:phosphopantothenoylcysteine decarboxylase/phosphopantothenate--cysteine ligase